MTAKPMSAEKVQRFLEYLDQRIEKHNENIRRSGSYGDHKELYKTERAEAEVIRNAFMKVLNNQRLFF